MGKTVHELLNDHKRKRGKATDETRIFLPEIGDEEHKHRKAIRSAHTMAIVAIGKTPPGIARNLWITLRDHAEECWLAPATLDEIADAAKLCRILWQAIQIAERRDGIIP